MHDTDDSEIGQAICADCFDYAGAVVWNALAGELWRRTTIATRRALAAGAGIAASRINDHARLSFTKVVEYQRRGVVHLHAVIRLDHPTDPAQIPTAPFDLNLLIRAVHQAASATAVPYPATPGISGHARWGAQVDVHAIGGDGRGPGAVAAYLAKYATKSTDPAGLLDHRLNEVDIERLDSRLTPHLAHMVRTAWDLGGRPELEHLRLRAWAHTLGFRGHWLTKSRAYSTTLTALRSARSDWHATRNRAAKPPEETVAVGSWQFVGRGWKTAGDAWFAATAGERTAEARRTAARNAARRRPLLSHRRRRGDPMPRADKSRCPKPLLSVDDTATLLGQSRSSIYRAIERGDLPLPVFTINGRLRIARRSVERLLAGELPLSTGEEGIVKGGAAGEQP